MWQPAALAVVALAALAVTASAGPLPPTALRLEYRDSPLGVDIKQPRFSWTLQHSERGQLQSKFNLQLIDERETIVWDTTVSSNKSTNVKYAGTTPLKPDTGYTWRVKYFDKGGNPSDWSKNATFSTGLFTADDWSDAKWIGSGSNGAYQLRKELTTTKTIDRAYAYIVGLGYYKLLINGRPASDHQLGAFTTYTQRVYYDTWDVTDNLRYGTSSGQHAVGVILGNGWYSQPTVNVGNLTLAFKLSIHYTDGTKDTLVSDTTWGGAASPVVLNDIYEGETYDARLETPGWTEPNFPKKWDTPKVMPQPSSTMKLTSHAVLPPIRIAESYTPCNMWESSPGVYVYDFCQNMAGFTTLRVPAGLDTVAGTNISQLHAEAIHGPPPASIYHHYGGDVKETVTYYTTGLGDAIEYTPLFTYMGFRYVQLTNYPGVPSFDTLTAHFIHTDYELAGDISFSDPNLDAVQHITRTAAMSNFQSIPTDCPQRERRGWLGDAQLSCETNIHNFFMAAPYTSFVQQIDDAQVKSTGATQDCVPWYGHGNQPADPAWGSAYTFIADWVRTYYHDDQIVADHYPGIRLHLESLINQTVVDNMDGLLAFSWWGDWCPPSGCRRDPKHHNSALVSSFMYLKQLRIVSQMAAELGIKTDAKKYGDLAEKVGNAFNSHFYDADKKIYNETGRSPSLEELSIQTCISLADELRLIPEKDYDAVIENLVNDVMVARKGHLNSGIVGMKYLLPTLSRAGRNDVALTTMQTETQPSFVYMVQQGATTLWETWTGTRYQPTASWNHIMFGSQSAWYYQRLAGIQLEEGTRGYSNIRFDPQVWAKNQSICSQLSSIEASMLTPRGPIEASWSCGNGAAACGTAEENTDLKLSCQSGTFNKVIFASFGTPNGTCASGFETWNCSSPNSVEVVEHACLGKSECTITASNDNFGGDPCLEVKKHLAVALDGCDQHDTVFTYDVQVPVGSVARVNMPLMGVAAADAVIYESSKPVFNKGKYVSGVAGVTGASVDGNEIVISIGSGRYSFTLSK